MSLKKKCRNPTEKSRETETTGQRATRQESTGHRNCGAARERIFLASMCAQKLNLYQISLYPNSVQIELVSQEG